VSKPKTEQYYVPTEGQPVKTLAEWQKAELLYHLKAWKDQDAPDLPSDKFNSLIEELVTSPDVFIDILSQVERGRPKGSKTKKPKPAVVQPTAA